VASVGTSIEPLEPLRVVMVKVTMGK